MAKELTDEMRERIKKCENTIVLAKVAASSQLDFWYDLCGKSGFDFNSAMTERTELCLKRIVEIEKLDGRA